jgi:hypothetical protein
MSRRTSNIEHRTPNVEGKHNSFDVGRSMLNVRCSRLIAMGVATLVFAVCTISPTSFGQSPRPDNPSIKADNLQGKARPAPKKRRSAKRRARPRVEQLPPPRVSLDEFAGQTVMNKDIGFKIIKARAKNLPQVGELAPDFELRTPDGKQTIRLSSFRGRRPLVLVFGSFT